MRCLSQILKPLHYFPSLYPVNVLHDTYPPDQLFGQSLVLYPPECNLHEGELCFPMCSHHRRVTNTEWMFNSPSINKRMKNVTLSGHCSLGTIIPSLPIVLPSLTDCMKKREGDGQGALSHKKFNTCLLESMWESETKRTQQWYIWGIMVFMCFILSEHQSQVPEIKFDYILA